MVCPAVAADVRSHRPSIDGGEEPAKGPISTGLQRAWPSGHRAQVRASRSRLQREAEAPAHAARLGFIVRYEQRDDGRWAAYFDRLDDPRVVAFTAASEERLALQVSMCLDIARRAVRGHVRRMQDRR